MKAQFQDRIAQLLHPHTRVSFAYTLLLVFLLSVSFLLIIVQNNDTLLSFAAYNQNRYQQRDNRYQNFDKSRQDRRWDNDSRSRDSPSSLFSQQRSNNRVEAYSSDYKKNNSSARPSYRSTTNRHESSSERPSYQNKNSRGG